MMASFAGPYFPDWSVDGANWPARASSAFVEAGRFRWHYQRSGQGPRVLFLHGTGAATHSWAPTILAMAGACETLNIDLPGHGFTRARGSLSSTLPAVAKSVASLLEAVAFVPEVIVGHSAGAAIAFQMVLDGLCAPRLVIGVNAALRPFPGVARFVFPAFAKALFLNPFAPYVFAQGGSNEERVRRLIEGTGSSATDGMIDPYAILLRRPGHIEGALRMMASWDLASFQSRLGTFSGKAHLIASANDRAVPPADLDENARHLGGVSHTLFPRLGHLAHEEAPEAFAAAILDLVAGRPIRLAV